MMGRCAVRHKAGGEPELYLLRGGADEGDFDLLSAEEELSLARSIEQGDQHARNRMVTANLRLVVKIARCYEGHGLGIDDLVGEGNLGLVRAADDYDPAFKVRFSTYAAYWIKQAIRHALTNTTSTIRLPSHLNGLMGKWNRAEHQMRRDLGGAPTAEQVADRLGLSEAQREMIDRGFRAKRLRQGGGDGGDAWDPDNAPDCRDQDPDADLDASDDLVDLHRRLDRLDARERAIVSMRFGLGGEPSRTLKEVGQVLGITREWVRKIEIRALGKLSDASSSNKTRPEATPRARPAPKHRGPAREEAEGTVRRRRPHLLPCPMPQEAPSYRALA
ncbi:MAG: RNA polymerase sigma factor RpoD/SigA [Isosphaeraceae bacterium]